jgi:RNA polymerase sigma-70 factor (ECF subfamily)
MRIDDATLARLMLRAQDGDAAAYRQVLETSRGWLVRFFARRIAPGQVDDLVQEVLISLHAKRATYDPARPFLPWLAAIARYRWVDALRRSYRAGEQELIDEPSSEADADEMVARISLDRLLALLPSGQAAAILAVKIEGLSVSEASVRCGQSESLVKVNIHRGLQRLAALVESD